MKKEKRLTLAKNKEQPLCNELKFRVLAVKEKLPKSGVTSLLIYKFPELDTVKKRSLISNVLQLRQTDEDITAKLEALAETINKLDESLKQK